MKWLFRVTWLYLLIPFILFCSGWLRLTIAIPAMGIVLWVLWGLWKSASLSENTISPRLTVPAVLLAGLWVLLSGVGGYAFQNYDFHARNAILRDLIDYSWPVIYAQPERGPLRMLVYYVGYWLPAALAGKLFGWQAANAFLFLWTLLGVLLAIVHVGSAIKTSAFKAALLLVGFSGLDAVGTMLFAQEYPTLWPPIQHLEIWSGILQYSSFTTQLFWVFNQAVPAWLCIVLFVVLSETKDLSYDVRGHLFLIWAVCFFFAPLVSIGLLPFLLFEWFDRTRLNMKNPLAGIRSDLILAGCVIALISYLYFSSNTAAQDRGLQSVAWTDAIRFVLLEGGLLWLLLAFRHRRDPSWMIAGVLLAVAPFVQLGGERDFVMRASIAPLFFLMIWCGATIIAKDAPRAIRVTMTIMLVIGSLTPLYEINRSVYRTFEYYFVLNKDQRVQPDADPDTHLEQGGAPEAEHPGALLADDIHTLAFLTDRLSGNYVANVRQSLYYLFIAPH